MPKIGRDRRSGRDDARERDGGGGLGGDADYDWIRYLGEGRTSSAAAPDAVPPPVQPQNRAAPQAAARPATLPARSPAGTDLARGQRRPPATPAVPDADPATLPPAAYGPAVGLTADRSGDRLFNSAAERYDQPLYAEPGPPPSHRGGRAGRSRREHDTPERPWTDTRMDTAEYASPLYPSKDAPLTPTRARPRRPEPADDPLADTAGRQGRPGRPDPLPRRDRSARTGRQPIRRAGAIAAIGDVTERAGVGPQAGSVAGGTPPEAGLLDRQPRKLTRPRMPSKTAGSGGATSRVQAGLGKAKSRAGRRVSRKVLAVGVAAAVAVLAAVGIVLFWPAPSHVVSTPTTLGSYVRQQDNSTAEALRHRIVTAARGDVKNVVAGVYKSTSGAGTSASPQIVLFIGGNLTGSASASSLISGYMAQLRDAFSTSPGRLGGQAACAPGSHGGPAECAWADNDTFGVLVSATLSSTALADEMRVMRTQIEHVAR